MEPDDRSIMAFRAKIQALAEAAKGKKTASKEKSKLDRVARQQSWSHEIKRVQRYLGIRKAGPPPSHGNEDSQLPSAFYFPDTPAPFAQESSVIFIAIDVEAWERSKNVITEIGIATLDTRDLATLAPGELGKDWREHIRARHFRIEENKHYQNTEFVTGCADRFEFG